MKYKCLLLVLFLISAASFGCGDPDAKFRPPREKVKMPTETQSRAQDSGGFLPSEGNAGEEKSPFED